MRRLSHAATRAGAPVMAAQWALGRVPFAPVRFGILCFLQFDGVPDVRPAYLRGPGLVRAGTPDDLDGLAGCQDKRAEFHERFAAGDRSVVAVVDGRLVGYEWFSDRPTHCEGNHGYVFEIPRGYIYNYDAYIAPRYRNSGFWLRFKAHQAALMRQTGKARVLTFVEYGNGLSLAAHLKFGFTPLRRVLAVHLLGIRVFKEQPADPRRQWAR